MGKGLTIIAVHLVFSLTNTDIGGDAADVEVSHLLVLDDLLQRGLAHLGVVKEGGVGVHLGVDPLVDDPGLGMHLEVRMQL